MTSVEAIEFDCDGDGLVGILHRPETPAATGVIIVVGGPQYRVGSHRQYVLLARQLSANGFAVLRFDCRGMGDSEGRFPGFEHIGPDIRAAVDTMCRRVPVISRVVLWGLCDAASACMIHGWRDERIAGLVALNPWVRSDQTLARAYLRGYYVRRLLSRDFWIGLLSGRMQAAAAARDLRQQLAAVTSDGSGADFVADMLGGLDRIKGPVAIILSGNDLVAVEFSTVAARADWQRLLAEPRFLQHTVKAATHTFSSAAWRAEVERETLAVVTMVDRDLTAENCRRLP
ncbi:MAG: hydrolase 1, exosortase A system-associated [Gammaproteobacteria bacterium]|nr:hydrolase 1, exosortase A system-associated [Gammaproteobacteria bacterium]